MVSASTNSLTLQSLHAPGPNSLLTLPFIRYLRNPLRFLQDLTRQYGDFVAFKALRHQMFFANHPDYIRDVLATQNSKFEKGRPLQKGKRILGSGLLTSEGAAHHRQRRLVLPAFHPQRIASYASVMVEHAVRTGD